MPKWETDARDRVRAAIRRFARTLADLFARDANGGDTGHLLAYHAQSGQGGPMRGHRGSNNGNVLAGRLEPRALRLVREWASLRHQEILTNWQRARRNELLPGIRHCRKIMNMSENYLPVVVGVAVVGDYVLRLLFSDGTVGDVDFSAERWTGVMEPLNDPAYFAQVTSIRRRVALRGPTVSTSRRSHCTSKRTPTRSSLPDGSFRS
jgi:hypothetical protein